MQEDGRKFKGIQRTRTAASMTDRPLVPPVARLVCCRTLTNCHVGRVRVALVKIGTGETENGRESLEQER